MDIKKIEKRIRKISNLVDLIKMDGKLYQIERDLLLDYVRKLYDDLLGSKEVEVSVTSKADTPSEKIVEPKIEVAVAPKPKITEAIVEKASTEQVDNKPKEEAKPILKEVNQEIPNVDEDTFGELFVFEEVKDLSNKLGMAKIDDINKAIGINERIFTIKELFGGDNEAFSSTVNALNNSSSFDEAKDILIKKVASKYNWDDEQKFKKAQHFIKIVRRLYA